MEFELDEYYFNRAGDKVRYVGFGPRGLYYFRECEYMTLYEVDGDGHYYHEKVRDYDITGKWEVNDDPDRVYIDYENREWRKGDFLIPNVPFGSLRSHLGNIKKILIKPRESILPVVWKCPQCEELFPEITPHTCGSKKIEPLSPRILTDLPCEHLMEKINELIAAYNKTS